MKKLLPTLLALLLIAGDCSAENFAGRILSASFYTHQVDGRGSLVVVYRVDRQGESSMISADPENLVGNIVVARCDRKRVKGTEPELLDAAQLMATYVEQNWQTDVDLVATPVETATDVPTFNIKNLVMPFPRSQTPLKLDCDS